MNFKKFLSGACVATMCLSGCGSNETTPTIEEEESEVEMDATAIYAPLMDLYRQAIEEKNVQCIVDYFPNMEYENHVANSEIWMSDNLQNVMEYAYFDINEDGMDELLIGYKDEYSNEPVLISVYSISDGEVSNLIQGWSRRRIEVLEDNTIYSSGSNGMMVGGNFVQYQISSDGSKLEAIAGVNKNYDEITKIEDGQEVPATMEEYETFSQTKPEGETEISWQMFF